MHNFIKIIEKIKSPPILFIIFNRPDLANRVFEQIKIARPEQLFIACDGPRDNHPNDEELCMKSREIIKYIDWPCKLETFFRKNNLGCKESVSGAINWFFQKVDKGIIIEDDCLPHPTFFEFCEELLNKYENDNRIMMISGNNFLKSKNNYQHSYYFSRFNLTWGWATWKRAWNLYDINMKQWKKLRTTSWLFDILGSASAAKHRKKIFDKMVTGQVDTWDYAWTYTTWLNNGLSIIPKNNLVSNIGFRNDATHTKQDDSKHSNYPISSMIFPLVHPTNVIRDSEIDNYIYLDFFFQKSGTKWDKLKRQLNKIKTR